MRKRFVFFYAIVSVVLVVTGVFLAIKMDKINKKSKEEIDKTNELNAITKYLKENNVKDIIKVKITSTGEIKEMKVSDYLKGVLPSEMPPGYDIEALKAQAVVARTYLYDKMSSKAHKDADICDSPAHCQAFYDIEQIKYIWENKRGFDTSTREEYLKKVNEAVDSTQNIVVTYNDKYIKAYFHACSGGKTEDVHNIWGKQDIKYLKSVESLGEEEYANYTSKVSLTVAQLEAKLNKDAAIPCSIETKKEGIVEILSYTDTGRVDKVKIGGVIYTAEKLRQTLGLKSTNFTVEYIDNKVVFNVTGYGHGVGMSQVGANYYANQGYTYDKIIKHYYTGVDVTYLYKEEKTNEDKI